jgi:DNA-binding NarL/FixJ family response regulator
MIRIALAEDNPFLAKSIQDKISLFPKDLICKFHASNGKQLIENLEKDSNIDVILMDIQMPFMDGIEATEIVNQRFPKSKVMMLTVLDDEEHIFKAIQAGANGYLLKDEKPNVLHSSILDIVAGGGSMSTGIALKALKLLRNPLKVDDTSIKEDINLSTREVDVLTHLSKGFGYKQIAESLFIAPTTVRKHIENIYVKLQVHSKMEAIQKAQKHRIIE